MKVKDETKPLTNLLGCEFRLWDIKNKSCESKILYDGLGVLNTLVLRLRSTNTIINIDDAPKGLGPLPLN